MNNYIGLKTAIEEAKQYLKVQNDGVDALKETTRGILTFIGIIISLFGSIQLFVNPIDFSNIGCYEILFFILGGLLLVIILKCLCVLSPTELQTPVKIDTENIKKLFLNKNEERVLVNCWRAYEKAIRSNRGIVKELRKKVDCINKVFVAILINIIAILAIGFNGVP